MNTDSLMEILASLLAAPHGQGRTLWALHKEAGMSLYLAEKALKEADAVGVVWQGTAAGSGGRLKRVWRLNPEIRGILSSTNNEEQLHALAIWIELGAASANLTAWVDEYLECAADGDSLSQSWKEMLDLQFQDWLEPAAYVFGVLPQLYTQDVQAWVERLSYVLG